MLSSLAMSWICPFGGSIKPVLKRSVTPSSVMKSGRVNQRPTAMRYIHELRSRAERQKVWPKPKHWKQKTTKSKCPCVNISVVRARLASAQNPRQVHDCCRSVRALNRPQEHRNQVIPNQKVKTKTKNKWTKPPIYMYISIHLLFFFFSIRDKRASKRVHLNNKANFYWLPLCPYIPLFKMRNSVLNTLQNPYQCRFKQQISSVVKVWPGKWKKLA